MKEKFERFVTTLFLVLVAVGIAGHYGPDNRMSVFGSIYLIFAVFAYELTR